MTGSRSNPDEDVSLCLGFLCTDRAQAKQVVETLRLVLSGAVEAARTIR